MVAQGWNIDASCLGGFKHALAMAGIYGLAINYYSDCFFSFDRHNPHRIKIVMPQTERVWRLNRPV